MSLKFLSKTIVFVKKKWIFVSIGVVILAVVIILIAGGRKSPNDAIKIERGGVVAEVRVTGSVKPARSLDIAFERPGRIASIRAKVGDKINQGQYLITQENADVFAQVEQAQAQLKAQESKLAQLQRGSRPEDIQIKRIALEGAQNDLANYYANSINIINDAYSKSNDAINKQLDGLFYGANSSTPTLTFTPDNNDQIKTAIEAQRLVVTKELSKWVNEMSGLNFSASPDAILQAIVSSQDHVIVVRGFLNQLLSILIDTGSLSPTALTAYKTNINTGLTNVNLAASSLSGQQQAIVSQKTLVQKTQNELDLMIAGSDPQDIVYQESQVDTARANLAYYQSQLNKTIIAALFDGIVTKIVPEIGDIVSANIPVISFIGTGNFQIEANIAESDIAKVKIGNQAKVTLDAYGSDAVFNANIIALDLSATVLEGVATYKTTLQFVQEDSRILPGLTANVDILSAQKDNVLFVPTRNIIGKDGKKYLRVITDLKNMKTEDVEVKVGLVGSDGRTEILSGVSEDALIVSE
ncbi:MAG: HlyD family efflux transporter periplasmic adaptor subunit [bacterium]|nr:HlyD family efflux transporter periplasmic adaptor subunit [bacterium]